MPLLLFGVAAQRVPLATLGMLQYLTPGLQMAWGVLVMHEDMPASRWIGFVLIWAGAGGVHTAPIVADPTSRRR